MANQVLPYVPDAWVDHTKTKLGYEIALTRHFYKCVPPRPLIEIDAEIKALESEIQDLPADHGMNGTMALKRAVTMLAGQSPPSEEVDTLDDEGLPFLQGNAEFGKERPSAIYRCDTAARECREGDILLSIRAPVGALNIADRRDGIGRGLCAIRATTMEGRFLWWLLHAKSEELHSLAVGSTYEAVTLRTSGPCVSHFRDGNSSPE